MTTRTLFRTFFIFLFIALLSSCSIFKSTEDEVISPDEIDQSSASLDEEDGEVSDEDGEETDDLAEDGDEGSEDDLAEEDSGDDEDLVEEELGDEEFAEDDSEEEIGDEEEIIDEEDLLGSDLDEESLDEIDDGLVEEELKEDQAAQDAAKEEFIVDAEPMEEEAAIEEMDEGGGDEMAISTTTIDASPGNQITNLEYKSFDSGGTVVIETASPAQYQVREEPDRNQIVIEVDDVQLPGQFKRPYIAKDFNQDVATITAYQPQGGSTARFVIQMKRPVQPFVQQEGNSILVMTTKDSAAGQDAMAVSMTPDPGAGSAGQEPPINNDPTIVAQTNGNGLPEDSNTLASPVKFQGEKINLEVAGVDVREVIQTISEQSGVNLIMDKDVTGEGQYSLA